MEIHPSSHTQTNGHATLKMQNFRVSMNLQKQNMSCTHAHGSVYTMLGIVYGENCTPARGLSWRRADKEINVTTTLAAAETELGRQL